MKKYSDKYNRKIGRQLLTRTSNTNQYLIERRSNLFFF